MALDSPENVAFQSCLDFRYGVSTPVFVLEKVEGDETETETCAVEDDTTGPAFTGGTYYTECPNKFLSVFQWFYRRSGSKPEVALEIISEL